MISCYVVVTDINKRTHLFVDDVSFSTQVQATLEKKMSALWELVILPVLNHYGWQAGLFAVLATSVLLFNLGVPIVIRRFLSSLEAGFENTMNDDGMTPPWGQFGWYALVIGVLIGASQFIMFGLSYFNRAFTNTLLSKYTHTVLDLMIESHRKNITPVFAAPLLLSIARAPQSMVDFLGLVRFELAPMVFSFLALLIYVGVALHPLYMAPVVGAMLAVSLTLYFGTRACLVAHHKYANQFTTGLLHYEDILDNIMTLLSTDNGIQTEHAMGQRNMERLNKADEKLFWEVAKINGAMILICLLLFTGFAGVSYYLYTANRVDGATCATSMSVAILLIMQMYKVVEHSSDLCRSLGMIAGADHYLEEMMQRIWQMQKQQPTQDNNNNNNNNNATVDTLRRGQADIVLDKVSFRYHALRPPVLTHFSVHIAAGKRVHLVGPSGRGKSTLMHLIAGRLQPEEGTIQVCGHDVAQLTPEVLARIILYVPQSAVLLHRTIYENIAYGTHHFTRANAQDLLNEYGLDYLHLDDEVGRLGSRLSGGQRQLVYLLRCVARCSEDPTIDKIKIVMLDEPTSAIDSGSGEHIAVRMISTIIRGRTALLINHNTDRVAHLFEKKIQL